MRNNANPIVSFLDGLLISGTIFGVVYIVFALLNFNLAGGETLGQIEEQNMTILFIIVLLALLAIVQARIFFKKGKKFTAYDVGSSAIVAFIGIVGLYLFNFTYPANFEKSSWARSKWKPVGMAASLAKNNRLKGLTRKHVKDLLGQGSEEYGNTGSERGSILYVVEGDWTLCIYFQKDKVVDTELRRPWLGV